MGAYFIKILVTFLVIMNPASTVPVFLELTGGDTLEDQRKTAIKATIIAGAILFIFASVGDWLMNKLAISSSALLVAGGILLLIFAIRRVLGGDSGRMPTLVEKLEAQHKRDVSVFPIAIPMIAGPGALTVVMFQVKQAAGDLLHMVILFISLLIVLAINGSILYYAPHVSRVLGVTGANVVTRVFGIILAAIAVQLILNGISKFMQAQLPGVH